MRIPQGFSVITPYLFVERAHDYVPFLKDALGAIEIGRHTRPDGVIVNCQLSLNDCNIMLREASKELPASRAAFYLYVENADETMQRAISHGAIQISAVGDRSYGDRQGGIKDPAGNIWWISQRLTDDPYY